MDFVKMALPMFWIWAMGLFTMSVASTVHKVGGSDGWTTLVPVDYTKWASSSNFHVGDSLLFSYNNKFHNVLQVNKQQFDSCNASSPVASYNSGTDSITLKRAGTFYFLCGFPGHCQVGQKVEIKVTLGSFSELLAPSSGPSPSQFPSPVSNGPAPVGSPSASAPTPTPSAASTLPYFSVFRLPLLPAYVLAPYSMLGLALLP